MDAANIGRSSRGSLAIRCDKSLESVLEPLNGETSDYRRTNLCPMNIEAIGRRQGPSIASGNWSLENNGDGVR